MITPKTARTRQNTSTLVASLIALGMGCMAAGSAFGNDSTDNPYSPAYGHSYRHGVVPTREAWEHMKEYASHNASPGGGGPNATKTLSYGGGVDGIGVTSGAPKVYLVVYGSQWGTQGTDANGNWTFSNDSGGAIPYLQKLFKGIGTNGELWSGVMTQYCDGAVSAGATTCPSGASFVPYPPSPGGTFAGIIYDNSVASPSNATYVQLGQEAVKAAGLFHNTTAASNRYAQYVILSPSGTHPDGFNTPNGGFCAWHDWNGDLGVASSYGDIALTNMPYVLDLGASCGQNFVNSGSAGTLDGFSIVNGHEYSETITDQNPPGGWTASSGQENADECAWISSGQGASANVSMATGTFAMQSTWSNDTNRCDISHPIVTGGGGGGGGPTAGFSFTTSALTANFIDASTCDTASCTYLWTFGDGSSLSSPVATSPSHTYKKPGSFSVTEKVTDTNNKSASATKTVQVRKH